MNAYEQGKDAHQRGTHLAENPYFSGTLDWTGMATRMGTRGEMGETMNQVLLNVITSEVERAEILYPIWPALQRRGDHVWAAAILCEEAGEVLKAALNWQAHGKGNVDEMRDEAIQTAAMAIRFLLNLDAVERQRINESARQDLQEEHIIYLAPTEGLQLEDWKEGAGL